MDRSPFKQTHETYNLFQPWQLGGIARRFVQAGESFDISGEVNLESGNQAELRVPALLTVYAFFVPARLIHADWAAQLAGDAVLLPTASAVACPSFDQIFDQGSGGVQFDPGWRRAYKKIWNEYFSAEVFAPKVVETTDTAVTPLGVRRPDARVRDIAADTVDPVDNYTVAASTIELNEFDRRQRVARRNLRVQLIGPDYLDQLSRFGVQVNEALVQQPQFLGAKTVSALPLGVENNNDTGERRGRWEINCPFRMATRDGKRFFFQEHGYLFVLATMRLIEPLAVPPDSMIYAAQGGFINAPDTLQRDVTEVTGAALVGAPGAGAWVKLNAPFVADAVYRGNIPNGVGSPPNGSLQTVMYPAGQAQYTYAVNYRSRVVFEGQTHRLRSLMEN